MPNLKANDPTYIRAAPIFIFVLGILSIVELGLGIKDGIQLSKEPIDTYFLRHYGRKPTTTQIAFYSATAAFVSLLYAPFDAYNYFRFSRRHLFSLIGSTALVITWICQIGFWTNCEELYPDNNGVMPWCPQYAMRKRWGHGLIHTPVQRAKFVLGYITAFTWLGYMVICAVTVHKARKAMKSTS